MQRVSLKRFPPYTSTTGCSGAFPNPASFIPDFVLRVTKIPSSSHYMTLRPFRSDGFIPVGTGLMNSRHLPSSSHHGFLGPWAGHTQAVTDDFVVAEGSSWQIPCNSEEKPTCNTGSNVGQEINGAGPVAILESWRPTRLLTIRLSNARRLNFFGGCPMNRRI